ncbi:Sden_1168 family B12-binding radical SAM P-methyltransferase [Kitasatospora cheerisanensis]|uniref:Radical SAM protein n=2 Tax=Kitasatospora TaxID=2063 RepID=A0A066YKC0_9ACTN|nr:Sden_1168 family B12-binding radical SAM P-methyltransferase [Kitasatospora cheerisanensis]AGZ94234.1 radical SAM domain protein [Kitasatospora sp. NRRL F-6133]KDN81923.1 radical SAM protein [Kitasatospora cheerisanensis KCTC 2395]
MTTPTDPESLRVRQIKLDDHLPLESDLRLYLAEKDETARVRKERPGPQLVGVREPLGRIPRTLLVLPPMCVYEGAVKRVVPPLGLCYIAGALEQEGIDISILDCIVEGIDEETPVAPGVWNLGMSEERFRAYVAENDFEVIGFTMIYSSDLQNLYRFARIVKEVRPSTTVIAGGLHASIYAKKFLQDAVVDGVPSIDFVLRGEGEIRLGDFLRNLANGEIDRHADGLAGWLDGEVFANPQFARVEDLDSLPFPAYHKVPMERYFEHNVPFSPYPRGKRVMQLYTSRGCPIGCTFCASTNFSKKYYARSVENVIAEIRHYKEVYGADEVQFADDNLTFDRKRAADLFDRMTEFGLPWCTPNGIMVNTLSHDLVDRMVRSGLYQITLSLDSGSAETLKEQHRKPVDLTRIPDLMAYLDERDVLMHGTLVVGMPGETEAQIEDGFAYVEQLPFHSINVFIAQAIPGSELFERAVSNGTITYEGALHIDTARSTLRLTSIDGERLEELVEGFLTRYNHSIYQRDPEAWERKYREHKERMARICVGAASAITSTIIEAGARPPGDQ